MRFPLIALLILLSLTVAIDLYIYKVSMRRVSRRLWRRLQLAGAVVSALFLVVLVALTLYRTPAAIKFVFWGLYAFLSVYLAKLIYVIFDLLSRIPCLWRATRMRPLSFIGAAIGVSVFAMMWWGALVNRYRLEVKPVDVAISGLQPSFDGYRIVQISDIHVGSYGDDTTFVSRMVDKVNSLNPDLVVFTGDIVNMNTAELVPFVKPLSRLMAADGVWAVLGNHDYGDYSVWQSQALKKADHQQLINLIDTMGWHLLNNESHALTRGADTLMLIGVENIGDPPFHTYGNLAMAYPTPADSLPKVLLSHNPAHWSRDIAPADSMRIGLTLAGHTHAMQISVGGVSPAAWRYHTWGGLYADSTATRFLYVNTGVGTVGIPARIGATPEITLITLHSPAVHESR